jgi:integrase
LLPFVLLFAVFHWKPLEVIHSKLLSFRLTNGRRKARQIVRFLSISASKSRKCAYCKVSEELSELACGEYYLSWFEGKRKRLDPVGSDPEAALKALQKKRLEMACVAAGGEIKHPDNKKDLESAYVAAGGEIKQPASKEGQESAEIASGGETTKIDNHPVSNVEKKPVSKAVKEYLDDCDDRKGTSGYGLAVRTQESYEYRLGFLIEFKPEAYLNEVDVEFVRSFRRSLRKHQEDLGDRTCYNIIQAVSTFLLRFDNTAAKTILKEMSFPPTVIPYSVGEMELFFAACTKEDELIFKFFLQTMARDLEVATCEVRDLKFDKNILHISPKPDRNFRLKVKRSGQAKNGRKVPIPSSFMARMKEYCKGKVPRDLLFTNGIGGIETHFLRRCKNIAKRAGLRNWKDFDLHRWRKT